ncbi:hypothetical protein M3Y99_00556200 [Aphelenchoides fujianensis]|nr:hypothetical protein M3Y99_00556200 [Aphelenchoides fujianensis]
MKGTMDLKERDLFMDNFRRILGEASPQDDLNGTPDYGDESDGNTGRIQSMQFDKDPAETRAQLIRLVHQHPELYDKTNQLYKNNAHKGVLWQSIAKEMGKSRHWSVLPIVAARMIARRSGKKVREQWSYMRRKYEEEYFSRKSGNAPTPTDPSKRHLFTYDQLSFLEPYITGERASDSPAPPNSTGGGLRFDPLLLDEVNGGAEDGKVVDDPFGYRGGDSERVNLSDLLWQLSNVAAAQKLQNGTNGSAIFDDSANTTATNNGRTSGPPSLGHLPASDGIEGQKFARGAKKRKYADVDGHSVAPPSSSSGGGTPPKCTASATAIRPMSPLNGLNTASMDVAQLNESVLRLSRCLEELMPRAAEDDCELFGRQVTNDLRKLGLRARMAARQRIHEILVEAILQEGGEENEEPKTNGDENAGVLE